MVLFLSFFLVSVAYRGIILDVVYFCCYFHSFAFVLGWLAMSGQRVVRILIAFWILCTGLVVAQWPGGGPPTDSAEFV